MKQIAISEIEIIMSQGEYIHKIHVFLADKLLPVSNAGISVDMAGNIDDYMAYKSIRRKNAGKSVNMDLYQNYIADDKKKLLAILWGMLLVADMFSFFGALNIGEFM